MNILHIYQKMILYCPEGISQSLVVLFCHQSDCGREQAVEEAGPASHDTVSTTVSLLQTNTLINVFNCFWKTHQVDQWTSWVAILPRKNIATSSTGEQLLTLPTPSTLISRWWWRRSGYSPCPSLGGPILCRPAGRCWRCRWWLCSAGRTGCRWPPQTLLASGRHCVPGRARGALPGSISEHERHDEEDYKTQ